MVAAADSGVLQPAATGRVVHMAMCQGTQSCGCVDACAGPWVMELLTHSYSSRTSSNCSAAALSTTDSSCSSLVALWLVEQQYSQHKCMDWRRRALHDHKVPFKMQPCSSSLWAQQQQLLQTHSSNRLCQQPAAEYSFCRNSCCLAATAGGHLSSTQSPLSAAPAPQAQPVA